MKKSKSKMSYEEKRKTAVPILEKNGYSDVEIEKILKLAIGDAPKKTEQNT